MYFFCRRVLRGRCTVLSILSLFALVYSLSPAFSNLLLIYGRTKTILLLSLVPVAVSLFTLQLLWWLGLNGLAVMRGLALLLSFAFSVFALSRVVRISLDGVALLKIFSCSAIMAIAVLFLEQLYYNKFLLPFYVVSGGAVYAFSLRFSRTLDSDDMVLLEQALGGRLGLVARRILYH